MKTFKSIISIFVILGIVITSLLLSGCDNKSKEPTIKIGLIAEITGVMPLVGLSAKEGALLAQEEINKIGVNVNGVHYKVELVIQDSESNPQKSQEVAKKLIKNDRVLAIIGPMSSGNAIPAAKVAEANRILLIAPWSTNPQTTKDEQGNSLRYIFRTCFTDEYQGYILSNFVKNTLKFNSVAVMYDMTTDLLREQARLFVKTFRASGGEVVASESYFAGNTNYTVQLQRIKESKPELVFLPSYYVEAPEQMRQARMLGIDAIFVGNDSWSSDFVLKNCGSYCNGVYFSDHYSADSFNPRSQEFVIKFQRKFNKKPNAISALTYDSFGLLFTALHNLTSLDRESLRNAFANIRNYDGVTGEISYGENSRDPRKSAVILKIENGQFVWVADVK